MFDSYEGEISGVRDSLYYCSDDYFLASPGSTGYYYDMLFFHVADDELDSDDTLNWKVRPVVCFVTTDFKTKYSLMPWKEWEQSK